ncbi:SMI1/KNR4 family protein [Bacillus sonorensis]|uniref:SMI1/KNR4 family protein n=1 Tax=Bacillus sp. KRF7 TaxID=2962681 RepID=UPI000C20ED27|nr:MULTISPECIES: SMI1/KNR4 family protein [Bacillus]MCY8025305.1 SMI1/KNR4 family protein [Bacillus sonorensis]MCY8271806.1 SMI1/KNR4 family protein [Bacillus sonorensis]MCY8603926.1 SMI1/KNR4 family protein [Bacillus sonorensis]MCZ0073264.1 SMI1/KNR4 family protein [Bacillus sonorensis]MCZ0091886.1 SMI1/KNR4 family protein [Bacillus sonorensis]
MPLTTFVDKTVNSLKSLLDHNGTIKLFGSEGYITEFQVTFSNYGARDEIQSFELIHSISFPKDYKKFLEQHNGARIFDIISDGENIGGGLHLFSLEEIEEELEYVELFEGINGIPIGHLLEECHLIIDKDRLKQGDPNYLYLFEDGLDYKSLNLNFEIFLDRYIMCQGEAFLEWSYRTAENYG